MGSRRRAGLAGLFLLLLLGAAGYLVLSDGDSDPHRSDEAHEVAVALRKLTTDPEALVARISRPVVGRRARQAVPARAKVTPQESSLAPGRPWRRGDERADLEPCGVERRLRGDPVRERSGWKVLATVPIRGGTAKAR